MLPLPVHTRASPPSTPLRLVYGSVLCLVSLWFCLPPSEPSSAQLAALVGQVEGDGTIVSVCSFLTNRTTSTCLQRMQGKESVLSRRSVPATCLARHGGGCLFVEAETSNPSLLAMLQAQHLLSPAQAQQLDLLLVGDTRRFAALRRRQADYPYLSLSLAPPLAHFDTARFLWSQAATDARHSTVGVIDLGQQRSLLAVPRARRSTDGYLDVEVAQGVAGWATAAALVTSSGRSADCALGGGEGNLARCLDALEAASLVDPPLTRLRPPPLNTTWYCRRAGLLSLPVVRNAVDTATMTLTMTPALRLTLTSLAPLRALASDACATPQPAASSLTSPCFSLSHTLYTLQSLYSFTDEAVHDSTAGSIFIFTDTVNDDMPFHPFVGLAEERLMQAPSVLNSGVQPVQVVVILGGVAVVLLWRRRRRRRSSSSKEN